MATILFEWQRGRVNDIKKKELEAKQRQAAQEQALRERQVRALECALLPD